MTGLFPSAPMPLFLIIQSPSFIDGHKVFGKPYFEALTSELNCNIRLAAKGVYQNKDGALEQLKRKFPPAMFGVTEIQFDQATALKIVKCQPANGKIDYAKLGKIFRDLHDQDQLTQAIQNITFLHEGVHQNPFATPYHASLQL